MELRITLEVFLARLKNLRLAPQEIRFQANSVLRGLKHLKVQFDPL